MNRKLLPLNWSVTWKDANNPISTLYDWNLIFIRVVGTIVTVTERPAVECEDTWHSHKLTRQVRLQMECDGICLTLLWLSQQCGAASPAAPSLLLETGHVLQPGQCKF